MALPPTYINLQLPPIDAGNLNAVNLAIYQLLGDGFNPPVTRLDVKTNLGIPADIAAGDTATLASANAFTTAAVGAVPTAGRLLAVQTFSATSPYVPTAGTNSVIVDGVGGGGAGGGAVATGAGQGSAGCGGGSGGRTVGRFLAPGPQTITIGAGGVAVSGAAGGNGGNTSFGALLIANGGPGGISSTAGALTVVDGVNGAAVSGTGGNIFAVQGEGTDPCAINTSATIFAGAGGASPLGGKARGQNVTATGVNGITPTAYGAGGSGAANNVSQGARAGGNGAGGLVTVYEYA